MPAPRHAIRSRRLGLRGHYVRVNTSGAKSFWVVARDPGGKQLVGSPPMKIEDASEKALTVIKSLRQAAPNSFEDIAAKWRALHCETREKGNAGVLVLSDAAMAIINAQPHTSDWVLPTESGKCRVQWSDPKSAFAYAIDCALRCGDLLIEAKGKASGTW